MPNDIDLSSVPDDINGPNNLDGSNELDELVVPSRGNDLDESGWGRARSTNLTGLTGLYGTSS